jgi:anti-sigma regulatory factor (Ser/Thr protein kinase)
MAATPSEGRQAKGMPGSRGWDAPPRPSTLGLPMGVPVPSEAGAAAYWDRGTGLVLGPDESAAVRARNMASAAMKLWGFSIEAVEVVTLPLSELTANAATATARLPARPDLVVWVRTSLDLRAVLVTVWDASPDVPVLRTEVAAADELADRAAVDDLDLGGRGLWIVDHESASWGYERLTAPPGVAGKVVWCVVMAPAGSNTRQMA